MTAIDTSTEAVELLLEDVTPGPWTVEDSDGTICLFMGDSCEMCNETYYPWVPSNHYDWHFIAAARDLVPALLKERDEARAALAADTVTLVFSNADATPKNTCIICDQQYIAQIMAWYGAYHAGDRYTVTVDGRNIRMDQNGEPTDDR